MEPTNCPRCGRVFMKVFESICPTCVKEEDQSFEEVRAYVKEHPNRSIKVVSEACNVSVKRILRYIREGKLEATTGMQADVTCSKCGVPIPKGRMCAKCIGEVSAQVEEMKPTETEASKADNRRMYTIQKNTNNKE